MCKPASDPSWEACLETILGWVCCADVRDSIADFQGTREEVGVSAEPVKTISKSLLQNKTTS